MRAKSILLAACLAILIAASCDNKAVTPIQPPDIAAQLIGNWLWVESCGGIAGNCFDTSAFGSVGITFTKDGIFYGWCDVCDPLENKYGILQQTSYIYGPDTIVNVIVIGTTSVILPLLIIKQLDDSSLTIIKDCGDCYINSYSKIRITDPVVIGP